MIGGIDPGDLVNWTVPSGIAFLVGFVLWGRSEWQKRQERVTLETWTKGGFYEREGQQLIVQDIYLEVFNASADPVGLTKLTLQCRRPGSRRGNYPAPVEGGLSTLQVPARQSLRIQLNGQAVADLAGAPLLAREAKVAENHERKALLRYRLILLLGTRRKVKTRWTPIDNPIQAASPRGGATTEI